jgi:trk system potassium uptake protein TrkA
MKQVCVIGLGRFGSNLAKALVKVNCEVLAIDMDENKVAEIRDLVHHTVVADVRNYIELEKIIRPDLDEVIISLGGSVEASILAAFHLKKIGLRSIRAKVFDDDHAQILKLIGVSETIFPERDTADRVASKIVMPSFIDFLPITEDYGVVELAVPKDFIGKTLLELNLRQDYHIMVIAVKDIKSDIVSFLPGGNYKILKGTILIIVGRIEDLNKLTKNQS